MCLWFFLRLSNVFQLLTYVKLKAFLFQVYVILCRSRLLFS